jgi:glutaredoxin 2
MSGRADIKAWQKKVADNNRLLQRPRYMMTILPEFMQADAKSAFVKNHPVPPFEKEPWKAMPREDQWKYYEGAYEKSLTLIDDLNASLVELDKMVYCSEYCTEGGLSMDDIDLWSRLRSVSIVKGVKWPEKLGKYMRYFEAVGDVPLYDSMAC